MSTQDERLERIRRNIVAHSHSNWNPPEQQPPLPPRSESLTDRIEYVLNMWEVERMDLVEKGTRLPKDWSWAVTQHIGAAVKPATLSRCERVKLSIQRRLRLIGEWFFRIAQ